MIERRHLIPLWKELCIGKALNKWNSLLMKHAKKLLVIPPKAHLEKVLGKSLHKRTHSCSHRSLRRHFCVCTRVDNLFPTTQVYIIVYTKTHINKHIHMHNHSLQVPLIRGPYHTFQTLILTWVEEGGTRVKLEVCAHYQRLYVIQWPPPRHYLI